MVDIKQYGETITDVVDVTCYRDIVDTKILSNTKILLIRRYQATRRHFWRHCRRHYQRCYWRCYWRHLTVLEIGDCIGDAIGTLLTWYEDIKRHGGFIVVARNTVRWRLVQYCTYSACNIVWWRSIRYYTCSVYRTHDEDWYDTVLAVLAISYYGDCYNTAFTVWWWSIRCW